MENTREQSEFNSSLSYLNRINTLLAQCDESAIELNAYNWFHHLMALFRELSTELEAKEVDSLNSERVRLADLLNENIRLQAKGRFIFSQELYDGLNDFELKLRRIMKESGLQMKMKEDAKFALK